jgi:hypothetical protein
MPTFTLWLRSAQILLSLGLYYLLPVETRSGIEVGDAETASSLASDMGVAICIAVDIFECKGSQRRYLRDTFCSQGITT